MKRSVSFRLVDDDGRDLTPTHTVEFLSQGAILSFCKAVKLAVKGDVLADYAASDLFVFANHVAFEMRRPATPFAAVGRACGSPKDPLIVLVPSVRGRFYPKPCWKPEESPLCDLATGILPFVNQETALQQLCEMHKATFVRAKERSRSVPMPIALADNEIGLGKTTFGLNYINRCREKWPDQCDDVEGFKESLRVCRTLCIQLKPHAFAKNARDCGSSQPKLEAALTETMNHYLARAVKKELDQPVGTPLPPYLVDPKTVRHASLAEAIVEDLGPVYIVLDEIGQAFKDGSDAEAEERCRKLFVTFCSTVLSTWMSTPGVYFMLTGYAPFLRNVQEKTEAFKITRLNLRLIRPIHIEEILRKTWVDYRKTETLAHRWGLHTRSRITSAAETVYRKTCGRPRAMVAAFRHFATYDDYEPRGTEVRDSTRDPLHNYHLWKWLPLVKKWLPSILDGTPIDLSKDWCKLSLEHTKKRRKTSFFTIENECQLGWEGTVKEAMVYALPRSLTAIVHAVQPLRAYLHTIHAHFHRLALTHATAFQWACLKRFQELFSEPRSPRTVLPCFFGADTVFGNLESVAFPKSVVFLPKITTESKLHYPLIEADTARVEQWPQLMVGIAEKLDASPTNRVCFKPLPESSSPDAVLVRRITVGDMVETMIMGIAVRNCSTVSFGPSGLLKECNQLGAIFRGLDTAVREFFGKMTTVLIVCATNYSDEYMRAFEKTRCVHNDLPKPTWTRCCCWTGRRRTSARSFSGWLTIQSCRRCSTI